MLNLFESFEYHYMLFSNIVGKKYAMRLSLFYHALVLIITIVLIENL